MENKENTKQITPMLKVSENIRKLKLALKSIEINGNSFSITNERRYVYKSDFQVLNKTNFNEMLYKYGKIIKPVNSDCIYIFEFNKDIYNQQQLFFKKNFSIIFDYINLAPEDYKIKFIIKENFDNATEPFYMSSNYFNVKEVNKILSLLTNEINSLSKDLLKENKNIKNDNFYVKFHDDLFKYIEKTIIFYNQENKYDDLEKDINSLSLRDKVNENNDLILEKRNKLNDEFNELKDGKEYKLILKQEKDVVKNIKDKESQIIELEKLMKDINKELSNEKYALNKVQAMKLEFEKKFKESKKDEYDEIKKLVKQNLDNQKELTNEVAEMKKKSLKLK